MTLHGQSTAFSQKPPQKTPTSSGPGAPGQKPPKLRLSCDACAAAKVRCSKDHPTCERCVESNTTCVYGPSMKHGKNRRKRDTDNQTSTTTLPAGLTARTDKYGNGLQPSFTDMVQSMGIGHAAFSPTQSPPPAHDFDMSLPSVLQPRPGMGPSSAFDDPYRPSGLTFDQNMPQNTGSLSPSVLDDPFLTSNLDFCSFTTPESSNFTGSPSASSFSTPSMNPSLSHDPSGQHDCYMLANTTLQSLHLQSCSLAPDRRSSMSSGIYSNIANAGLHQFPNLDDILRRTRDAMGNIVRLLRCSCVNDPQMGTYITSIIIRIIIWHQVAAGSDPSSASISSATNAVAMMDSIMAGGQMGDMGMTGASTPASTAFIAPEPIKIGSFVADQEDQEPMRKMITLINLKKLGRLIEFFAQTGKGVDAGPNPHRVSLASWLSSELSHAIKQVGHHLSATYPTN